MSESPEMTKKNMYLIQDIELNTKNTYEVFNDPDDPNEQGKYIGHYIGIEYGGECGYVTFYVKFDHDDKETSWDKRRWFRIIQK